MFPLLHPIRLIGAQQVISSNDSLESLTHFYGGLFARLTKEVRHTGDLTRYVGFQCSMGGNGTLHFFGIEVNIIEEIPPGLIAWELTDHHNRVWASRDGKDVLLSQEEIEWQWLTESPGGGRFTGEFIMHTAEGSQPFWISTNAYVGLLETNISSDEIFLVDHDPTWEQKYNEMAQWLSNILGKGIVLRIEHFGSTAIPGISAKPIIDILVEVPSVVEARQRAVPLLNSPEWEYWWNSDHMLFIKRDKLMGQRNHHIHIATTDHPYCEGIAFRDHLREHPQDAQRYAELKQSLTQLYRDDRERYTDAKTEFVRGILDLS